MEQSFFWEADRCSVSQKISRILCNVIVHYFIQNRLPPVPIPSQINPIHAFPSHFLKIHFTIVPRVRLGLQISLFHSGFLTVNLCVPLHMPHAPPTSCFFIWSPEKHFWGIQIIKLLAMLSSPFPHLVPLGPNVFLSTLFSNTLRPYSLNTQREWHTSKYLRLSSSANVKDQASHPHKK